MEVEEALYRSSHLVVVLSPASRVSEEVRGEWRAAVEEGIRVIPVLLQECRIPLRLRLLHHIDFTSRSPTDEDVVGEIVRALDMQERAREEKTRPPAPSEVWSGEPVSERLGHLDGKPALATGSVICSACEASNVPGEEFCVLCGARLKAPSDRATGAVICPACEAGNVPGEKFCDYCGSPLEAP